jgi:hypothetical protein
MFWWVFLSLSLSLSDSRKQLGSLTVTEPTYESGYCPSPDYRCIVGMQSIAKGAQLHSQHFPPHSLENTNLTGKCVQRKRSVLQCTHTHRNYNCTVKATESSVLTFHSVKWSHPSQGKCSWEIPSQPAWGVDCSQQ